MSKFLITCFFIFVTYFSFAQQSKIDSLLSLLKNDKEDTNKVNALNNLAFNYVGVAIDTTLLFAQQAHALAEKSGFQKGVGDGLNNIGLAYYYQSDFLKALDFFSRSLKIRETLGIKSDLAFTLMGIGNVYDSQGDYDKALGFLLKALKIREEIKDSNGIAKSLNNIGIIYWRQDNMDKALECHQQALAIRKKTDDKAGIAFSLGNLGTIQHDKAKKNKDTVELKIALEYFQQALQILRDTFPDGSAIGNWYAIAVSFSNIANVKEDWGKYDDAIDFYMQSLKIREQIEDKDGMVTCLVNTANIYSNTGNVNKSFEFLNRALKISNEIRSKDALKSCYGVFCDLYVNKKNFKRAYEYHLLFSQMKDSLFNEESSKQIAEMSAKYETEKKEQQIKLIKTEQEKERAVAASENKRQRLFLLLIASVAIAVAVIAVIIFRSLGISKKQNRIIAMARDEITHKNKEITDSIRYAERIQLAMLPFDSRISKTLKEYFVLFKPKDVVSGDFYWFAEKDGKAVIAAIDCTGHGVPGAFMSMIGNELLNHIVAMRGITQPNLILTELDSGIRHALKQEESRNRDGMDISLATIDFAERKIYYSGAKNPLVYIQNGELNVIKANKFPVGGLKEEGDKERKYDMSSVQFASKNNEQFSFYLFTDGFQDQFGGEKEKKFMLRNLRELLLEIYQKPMGEQRDILNKTIEEWRGNLEQVDDICIIGVRV